MPHDWPALCIGVIVGAYWARVLKLALKQRRQSGHAANFLPPEPLGRALRLIWIPVVALWIGLPFVAAWHPRGPHPFALLYEMTGLRWSAVAVALAALIVTLLCWKRMGKSWRMGINPAEKTQLIVSGPYSYVRHPIYALSSLLVIASAVAVPTILMICVALVHCALLQWEARREERYLLGVHGRAYATYLASVGRFVPRSLGAQKHV